MYINIKCKQTYFINNITYNNNPDDILFIGSFDFWYGEFHERYFLLYNVSRTNLILHEQDYSYLVYII